MNIGVIPARLGSTRFPEKILAPLQGRPLVLHAYERACRAASLDEVLIAVDDEQVRQVLEKFGARVVMTSRRHQSGTDRVAEAVAAREAEVVVNIQGDEPLLEPALVDDLVDCFQDPATVMATAAARNLTVAELLNPNVVKVFLDESLQAVDFRRLVPDHLIGGCYRHVGIYAFRPDTLLRFTQLPPGPNEIEQRLEQLRALDNGIPIRAVLTTYAAYGVDTKADLELVASIMENSIEPEINQPAVEPVSEAENGGGSTD